MTVALWDWAKAAYGRPGVAEACLELQDRHGQSVPLLLWAGWAGPVSAGLLERAVEVARAWETVAVAPLREVRRAIREPAPLIADAAREAAREQVQAAELQAERALLESLGALVDEPGPGLRPLQALLAAAHAWSEAPPGAELARLAALLDHPHEAPRAAEPIRWRPPNLEDDAELEEVERQMRARLALLSQEHADLDAAAQALAAQALPDLLVIGRLKRKKLALKDEIARIRDQLTPDIIA